MRSLVFLALAVGSCTSTKETSHRNWSSMSPDDRQAAIAAISVKCAYPVDRMRLVSGIELHFQPQPDDKYSQVECALSELNRFPGIKLGFVGNEAYSVDAR